MAKIQKVREKFGGKDTRFISTHPEDTNQSMANSHEWTMNVLRRLSANSSNRSQVFELKSESSLKSLMVVLSVVGLLRTQRSYSISVEFKACAVLQIVVQTTRVMTHEH